MCELYKLCPKDAVCQISEYLNVPVHEEEDFLKFTKFYQLLGPNRCQPLNFGSGELKIDIG